MATIHPNIAIYRSGNMNQARRHAPDGVFDDVRETIDNTPKVVGALGLGALLALVLLKRAGFRFAVGVNLN